MVSRSVLTRSRVGAGAACPSGARSLTLWLWGHYRTEQAREMTPWEPLCGRRTRGLPGSGLTVCVYTCARCFMCTRVLGTVSLYHTGGRAERDDLRLTEQPCLPSPRAGNRKTGF